MSLIGVKLLILVLESNFPNSYHLVVIITQREMCVCHAFVAIMKPLDNQVELVSIGKITRGIGQRQLELPIDDN